MRAWPDSHLASLERVQVSDGFVVKRAAAKALGSVAQLVRASPRQGEGRRFESVHSHQLHLFVSGEEALASGLNPIERAYPYK